MSNDEADQLNKAMIENQPAFPVIISHNGGVAFNGGMSLRDYFAAQVISEIMRTPSNDPRLETAARRAYQVSDAMISERNKTTEKP